MTPRITLITSAPSPVALNLMLTCMCAHPSQMRGLLSVSASPPHPKPVVLMSPGASDDIHQILRVANAANLLSCARVAHQRCRLPKEVMACAGVALVWPTPTRSQDVATATWLRRCVTRPEDVNAALNEHVATISSKSDKMTVLRGLRTTVIDWPPARTAIAVGDAMRGAPIGRMAVVSSRRVLGAAMQFQGSLLAVIAGLVVWSVRAVALGGPLPWARSRGSRGRKLGRSPRRRSRRNCPAAGGRA